MGKKAFTLIEVLTVILLLGIIALITTPIVTNVINEFKEKSYDEQIKRLKDAAYRYSTSNDLDMAENTSGTLSFEQLKQEGLISKDDIKDPRDGQSLKGCIIYRWDSLYKQFEFNYNEDCEITDVALAVTVKNVNGNFNDAGWAKEDFYVKIETTGTSYKYCVDSATCTPNAEVNDRTGTVYISNESSSIYVCAQGKRNEEYTEVVCGDVYKLDKTKPDFTGISDIVTTQNTSVDLNKDVTVYDGLSGILGSYTFNPAIVDTSKVGNTNIVYTVSDIAGNTQSITRKVIVNASAPEITFTPQAGSINARGWAKNNFYVKVDFIDRSSTGIKEAKWCSTTSNTCVPNATVTGTSMNPLISTESNNNRICVQAIDNNNTASDVICSDAYKLDKTIPNVGTANIVGTLGNNNWYTSNVTISPIQGSDVLSGHLSTVVDVTSITSDIASKIVTVTTKDLADNIATRSYTIKVDKTAPNAFNPSISNVSSYGFTVTAPTSDAMSGVNNYQFYVSGAYKGNSTNGVLNVSGLNPGTNYSIYVVAQDNAGNTVTSGTVNQQTTSLYTWYKYSVEQVATPIISGTRGPMGWCSYETIGTSYSYNSSAGQYEASGSTIYTNGYNRSNFNNGYRFLRDSIETRTGVVEVLSFQSYSSGCDQFYYRTIEPSVSNQKGVLLGSVTSTNINTYPANGISGGYWYVRQ